MRRLQEEFANNLVVIHVHAGKFPAEKELENIRAAALRRGMTAPIVNDAHFDIWTRYAVKAWPSLYLIDPQGKIVHSESGEILADEYAPKIEYLIEEFSESGLLNSNPLTLTPEAAHEPPSLLKYPAKLLLNHNALFIADSGHHRLLQVALADDGLSGRIETQFGTGESGLSDGPAAEARFNHPHGLSLSGSRLYVADTENHAIRLINLESQTVQTLAGTGEKAHHVFDIPATATETALRSPWDVLALPAENLVFIAMAGSHQIWVLLDDEQIGPFFGSGQEALIDGSQTESGFNQPSGLAWGLNHLFVADAEASAVRAISLGQTPQVVTLIGQGLFAFGDIDGLGAEVRLQHPTGLVFHQNLLYIADTYNHKIKTLNPTTGEVKTLIGTGQAGHADGPFATASLYEPLGVVAHQQRLYIADTNNHRICVADLKTETIYTLALD